MQFLIETDVLRDFLRAKKGEETLLRKALRSGTCYTTMVNALELFRSARTKKESEAILQMLMAVRVLGFSARYAEGFAAEAHEIEQQTGLHLEDREVMIVGMAKASKLIILTKDFFHRYQSFGSVLIKQNLEEVPGEKE
jgi:predicted nucleic acid-binding protein